MKKLAFVFLLLQQVIWAQNGFEKGNTLYQKGQYQAAIEAYQSVLDGKQQSAEVYFNLANCYYKLNQVAPAIYNYEKALVLSPGDAEIQNNLKFAQKMTIDEIKEVPKVGFAKLLRDFTGIFHYDSWAWIAVVFSTLFLLFFLGYYFSQTTLSKRIFFIGMFVLVFLVLISILAAVFEKDHYKNERPAIVFAESAQVKGEPKTNSSDVFILHEGTKVYVLETLDDWRKVALTDGAEGWIEASNIREVK
ncbi:tetratricopeptide repeat protein [Flavobacterium sp. CYK-4]|uniref:tetratricopeptide repeat protein n=1 Tax=Flavobacterium lotistagni TaxID=2709660 RepID=UPI0014082CE5|nr:tetratricopeptide repeat protein [Flavobacterium lotistagni]NHM06061.1 tetratricopeptide repeat protein [Flavobacterium lotistagni]